MEHETTPSAGFRKYLPLTFLIGFGFFTMGLMDPLYDTYVPLFLKRYITSNAAIGGVMTLDNILQLLLIPIVSVWSDRTRTRIGRRMPFIVTMLPAAALFFAAIPDAAAISFWALIAAIFCLNIFKTSVRGPVVALMPDTIPGDYRSEANGVINTMGGIGLIVGTLGLARLTDSSERAPFVIAAVCVVGAVVVLALFVKERAAAESSQEKREPVFASIKAILASSDRSVLRILIAIFFWFMAYEGAKPFLGMYLVEVLSVSGGKAALAQGVAGISGVALAIPAGYLAHRVGRRNFIRSSLIGLAVILAIIVATGPISRALGLTPDGSLILFLGLMFLYGAVWIGVVVNSFPMLWQMANYENTGIYTGLYYTASQTAAIAAPPITGAIIDLAGFPGIFLFGSLCMCVAWISMGGVRKGEASQAV
jgi:maltose/moltooligosaccharide transporter